ncbi:LysR family transcriptional regulator [Vibrio sp. WXL210]|uniref:LysR family transcriptional regulator n=1 Tax=Vibrio sp. WXL210 TaxID=3450709 RepID=UPI003EC93103
MISIDLARYFTLCFELGSYSQASRAINKSRVTVREQVKQLEDLVGSELFEVQGKSLVPSVFAKAIYPDMKQLVEQSEQLNAVALALFNIDLTTINICFDNFLPNPAIRQVNKMLAQQHPNIVTNWRLAPRDESLQATESNEVHIAIYPHRQKPYPTNQVGYQRLGDVSVGVYVSAHSELAKHEEVSLKKLRGHKQYITENMTEEGLSIYWISNQRHSISSGELLISLLQDDGFAALPNWSAHPYVQSGQLKKLKVTEISQDLRQGLTLHFPISLKHNPIINMIKELFCEQLIQ